MSAASPEAVRIAYAALRDLSFDRLRARSGASESLLDDYLKFIACKAASADYFASFISCPPEVDAVWHEHLLDTVSYCEMCEAIVPAGRFIHHNPDGGQDVAARAERRKRGLALYEKCFGEAPAYWKSACASRKRPAPTEAGGRGAAARAAAGGSPSRARHDAGGMRIFVKSTCTGRTLEFRVEPSDSIAGLAERIQAREGIRPEEMRLVHGHESLKGLPDIDSRHVLLHKLQSKTVAELEGELRAKGLNVNGGKEVLIQRLRDAMVDEDRRTYTLSYYGIREGSEVVLVRRERGC